jgi:hypothetical protein
MGAVLGQYALEEQRHHVPSIVSANDVPTRFGGNHGKPGWSRRRCDDPVVAVLRK